MEQNFRKMSFDCLRQAARNVHNEEQTQEVRLPDAMPDIGRVLCAWGQPVIRSKEWRSGSMSVSGGVMAWALYAPEDGSEPQSVETWIPFQMRWDFPETERDGTVIVACLLRSVDARSIAARKLLIRVSISVMGEALEPTKMEISVPEDVPEDVQLLRKNYPVRMPKEAGEKTFLLDEELVLPASCPQVEKVIYYTLQPQIIDRKVMADKVVFRGAALVHLLYAGSDGGVKSWDFEIPFSQYTDLEREHDQNATANVVMAVTNLELEKEEQGSLRLKAGLTGQYVIYGEEQLSLVEDAYSPSRSVSVQSDTVPIPALLDMCQETMHLEQSLDISGSQIVDVFFSTEHPSVAVEENMAELTVEGTAQVLFCDQSGALASSVAKTEGAWRIPCDPNGKVQPIACPSGSPKAALGGGASVRCDVAVEAAVTAQQGLPMVTGLELGEMNEPDPARPSLVLKRADDQGLWNVAKQCGSTVEAIRKANHLTDEPVIGQILLIPIA